jgi:hypothetical protein
MASKIRKATDYITKKAGAAPLADYVGAKMAKAAAQPKQRQYISDTTTARQARNSAIKLAGNVTAIASLGIGGSAAMAASKARRAAKAATVIPKRVAIAGQKAKSNVHNWANAKQTPITYRKPKLTIKRYK